MTGAAKSRSGVQAPAWLAEAFPGHSWQSLSSCNLNLDKEVGAGLQLEASEFGYVVDIVECKPGQDAMLCQGAVILEIEGCCLLGLDEDSMEEAFGAHIRDGVPLLLVGATEIKCAAAAKDEAAGAGFVPDTVLEHGNVVHVFLCKAGELDTLAPGVRSRLSEDLSTFANKAGVRAEIYSPAGDAIVNVVLTGIPEEISSSRAELDKLLQHYKLGVGVFSAKARGVEERAEEIEVDGMVMQSLPARGRRRRRVVEEPDDTEGRGEKVRVAGEQLPVGCSAEVHGMEVGEDRQLQVYGKEERQFEYMDHTADVILHSWGQDLREAFSQVCVAFFSYMTDLDKLELQTSFEVTASGHDILDLLYHLLDEFLFHFGTTFVMCRRVDILELDEQNLKVKARGYGEKFDLTKHPQGTEIKAITMHQMKILTPSTLTTEDGTVPRKQSEKEGGTLRKDFPFECYVLVDI